MTGKSLQQAIADAHRAVEIFAQHLPEDRFDPKIFQQNLLTMEGALQALFRHSPAELASEKEEMIALLARLEMLERTVAAHGQKALFELQGMNKRLQAMKSYGKK